MVTMKIHNKTLNIKHCHNDIYHSTIPSWIHGTWPPSSGLPWFISRVTRTKTEASGLSRFPFISPHVFSTRFVDIKAVFIDTLDKTFVVLCYFKRLVKCLKLTQLFHNNVRRNNCTYCMISYIRVVCSHRVYMKAYL